VAAAVGAAAVVGLLASGFAGLVREAAGPSAAAAAGGSCEQAVVGDWKQDGRVDGVYPLSCYRRALAQLPADVRDYSDAPTEIERALAIASNHPDRAAQAGDTARAGDEPPPLVLIAVGALVVLVAALATAALLTRVRRRPAS
jgi:hypothetical protein